jgi:hypothetical protein
MGASDFQSEVARTGLQGVRWGKLFVWGPLIHISSRPFMSVENQYLQAFRMNVCQPNHNDTK